MSGQNAFWAYGPDNYVERDVIMVQPNHRLGPFGFTDLGIPEAPGNQVISNFGKNKIKSKQNHLHVCVKMAQSHILPCKTKTSTFPCFKYGISSSLRTHIEVLA